MRAKVSLDKKQLCPSFECPESIEMKAYSEPETSSSETACVGNSKCWQPERLIVLVMSLVLCLPVTSHADQPSDDFSLAVGLFRKQRWQLAAETFNKFLEEHPQHPRADLARLYYGLSLNSLEQYEPARIQFEKFIANNPSSVNAADARYRLGECSFFLKDYPTAISQLSEFLSRHEDHDLSNWARLMIGNSYNSLSEWAKAEAILNSLLQLQPDAGMATEATFAMARSQEGRGRKDEAIQLYQQVVDAGSSVLSPRALARIGTLHFQSGEFVRASEYYDLIGQRYPGHGNSDAATLQSAIARYRQAEFREALARLELIKSNSTLTAQVLMLTGLCQRELGRTDEARKLLLDAYTAAGNTPLAAEILFKRAQVEQLDDQKAVAARMFQDLADRWPHDRHVPDCLFYAAEIWMELQDPEASQRALDRLVTDFPEQASSPSTMARPANFQTLPPPRFVSM